MARAAAVSDPIVEIEGLRERIAELQGEVKELLRRDTMRPKEEAEAYIRELVATAAAQGGSPTALVAEVASRLSPAPGYSGVLEQMSKKNPFLLLCALLPQQVEEALCAGLDDVYNDESRPGHEY